MADYVSGYLTIAF